MRLILKNKEAMDSENRLANNPTAEFPPEHPVSMSPIASSGQNLQFCRQNGESKKIDSLLDADGPNVNDDDDETSKRDDRWKGHDYVLCNTKRSRSVCRISGLYY